jgi:hypothetical protein
MTYQHRLIQKGTPVLPEIEEYKPRVPKPSLFNEQEAKLGVALSKSA